MCPVSFVKDTSKQATVPLHSSKMCLISSIYEVLIEEQRSDQGKYYAMGHHISLEQNLPWSDYATPTLADYS